MCLGFHLKYSLFFPDFNNLEFNDRYSTNPQLSTFIKIRVVVAELFTRTDGQTYRHKDAIRRFSQFCERS